MIEAGARPGYLGRFSSRAVRRWWDALGTFVADSDNERIQSSPAPQLPAHLRAVSVGNFTQLRHVAVNPTTGDVYGADLWTTSSTASRRARQPSA